MCNFDATYRLLENYILSVDESSESRYVRFFAYFSESVLSGKNLYRMKNVSTKLFFKKA